MCSEIIPPVLVPTAELIKGNASVQISTVDQARPTTNPADAVGRCRILVVEDEYIVAFDLCAELATMGIDVVGPAGKLEEAAHLAATSDPLHGALLDVNVAGREVFPVADILSNRGIPYVFATAYDKSVLPEQYRTIAQVEKPVMAFELQNAMRAMCAGSCRLIDQPS